MTYELRPIRADDLLSITGIYNAARESTRGTRSWDVSEMKQFLFASRPSIEGYACVDGDAVVGWSALTRHHAGEGLKHTAEMSLYVQEDLRRRGIGALLANTLLERAPTLNLHCILALALKDTPDVLSFAQIKCGFSVAGCIPELFSDGERHYDIVVFEKLIRL
ncbi:GNAT family N-acetyltransferase [Bradyrhizobium sp. Ghvi]|uniref:GNAT family N-acetyltransferase n=1 Tax=Bradyrhizobium sp. Ghvi TaxID=1855319 RepID=UPI000B843084|nr:GNAT family N-acetyltransferase [Bradyrhizobium sp. Ghvi]